MSKVAAVTVITAVVRGGQIGTETAAHRPRRRAGVRRTVDGATGPHTLPHRLRAGSLDGLHPGVRSHGTRLAAAGDGRAGSRSGSFRTSPSRGDRRVGALIGAIGIVCAIVRTSLSHSGAVTEASRSVSGEPSTTNCRGCARLSPARLPSLLRSGGQRHGCGGDAHPG